MAEDTDLVGADEGQLTPQMERAYARLSRRAAVVTIVLVLCVLAGAVYIGTTAVQRRLEAAKQLDRATVLLERADGVVLDIDRVVRAKLSAAVAQRAEAALARVDQTRSDLERAVRFIDDARDKVTEDEQRQALLMRAAAVARMSMLGPAKPILDATVKAGTALDPATKGWEIVLGAEKTADSSVAEYNKLTPQGVAKSSELASEAAAGFSQARPYFVAAATALPGAGFDRYLRFIDAKLVLLRLSRQSNAAWLKDDIALANTIVARYNVQERKLSKLGAALPRSPGEAVAEEYETLASRATEQYNRAREAAARADARLEAF